MRDYLKNSVNPDSGAAEENDARLNLLYEFGRILASGKSIKESALPLLEAICRNLKFEVAELWLLNKTETLLLLKAVWYSPTPLLEKFAAASRDFEFSVGVGLPGRAWAKSAPVWVEGFSADDTPRRTLIMQTGLETGFAFPLSLGEKLLGVISCFSADRRKPDKELLQMFIAVGDNIGQFIERESIENHLRESEVRYRAFISQSTEGIWRFELDEKISVELPVEEQIELAFQRGYLAECNDAMAQMYGLERAADLVGCRISDLLDMSDAANVEYLRSFIESNYNLTDAESHEKDANQNDKYFLNSLVGTIENGYLVRVWGTQRDITDSRRAEEALRESQEVLSLAMQSSRMGAWSRDLITEKVYWSAELEEIFGLAAGTFIGNLNGFYDYVYVEDKGHLAREVRNALNERRGYIVEFRFHHADGSLRWMEGRGQGIYAPDGTPVKVYGIGVDITERKQAEAERERLLESERQARENAERANHSKDEFIALVSHELRSPLNAMLGWTRILQKKKADEEATDHALNIIVKNARSQSRLIEDLLDIARIGGGKLRLEMQPTEIVPIIEAAVDIIKPTADVKNINIVKSLDTTANFLFGDQERLRQIVENLLSNAVKFTPEGGKIEILLERRGVQAQITVRDTGQGIAPEFLPQIFERFKQADSSTTRRHGGLGIGLSLARDLVELHSGTISAQSDGDGKGSTFVVNLPLRTEMSVNHDSDAEGSMNSQGRLDGYWILAVDDEADAREIVSFMLQINGAKVTTANSAVEALEILNECNGRLPDILLSDISMPFESGYALVEKIRALPDDKGGRIPAVALTAFNRPEDREAAFEAGFQKHLGKPVDMDALIEAIIETAAKKTKSSKL